MGWKVHAGCSAHIIEFNRNIHTKNRGKILCFHGRTWKGELDLDLQPHWPKAAGRVWASLVPLPEGYPYRYVLLTMDRPNFPGIIGANWSYGGLYFYGAD